MQQKDQWKQFQTMLADIRQGKVAPVYLLHGPELYLADTIEKEVIAAWLPEEMRQDGLVLFDSDPSVEELASYVESVSMFVERRVVVVRHSHAFKAAKKGAKEEAGGKGGKTGPAEMYLQSLSHLPDETKLILRCDDKADRRLKLFQQIERQGMAIEAVSPRPHTLASWLEGQLRQRGKKLEPKAQQLIGQMLSLLPGVTLAALDQEVEKLAIYCGNRQAVGVDDLEAVFRPASGEGGPQLFLLLDRWLERDYAGMLTVWQQAVRSVDDGFHFLRLWGNEVRSLLEVKQLRQAGETTAAIAGKFRWVPFVAEKKVRHAAGFTLQELSGLLQALAKIECEVKLRGREILPQLETLLITGRN